MGRDPTIEFYHQESEAQRAEIERLRVELAAVKETFNTAIKSRDSVIRGLRIDCERLNAAASQDAEKLAFTQAPVADMHVGRRQDAEEKARLRKHGVSFGLHLASIITHWDEFGADNGLGEVIEAGRAALACRPQGEKS